MGIEEEQFLVVNIDICFLSKLGLHSAARSFKHFPCDLPHFSPTFCYVAASQSKVGHDVREQRTNQLTVVVLVPAFVLQERAQACL